MDPSVHSSVLLQQLLTESENMFGFSAEQAKSLKDEGNAYFREKNYQKAVLSYTAGLKKSCADQDLSAVLLTNRAASHFHLGNNIHTAEVEMLREE